jgi:hypothetical protein
LNFQYFIASSITLFSRAQPQLGAIKPLNGHSLGWVGAVMRSSRQSIGDGRRAVLRTHKYSIGQNVRYTAGPFSRFGASGSFKIVKLLPPEGDEQQYRIKSAGEAFERVAKESQLDRDR